MNEGKYGLYCMKYILLIDQIYAVWELAYLLSHRLTMLH